MGIICSRKPTPFGFEAHQKKLFISLLYAHNFHIVDVHLLANGTLRSIYTINQNSVGK
jgi:hypothetical protein